MLLTSPPMCRSFQYLHPQKENEWVTVNLTKKGPLLPVEYKGQERQFPWKGFCQVEGLKKGAWQELKPKLVKVKVTRGQSNGVHFQIRQGVYALFLDHPKGKGLYILTQPSTHYYRTMTGATRMPILINQVI